MKFKCNEGCNEVVHVNEPTITKLQDGVQRVGLTCPKCEHEYVSFYTNVEIRRMQYKLQKKRGAARDKLRVEIESKMKQLRQVMDEGSAQQQDAAGESESNSISMSSDESNERIKEKQAQ